MTPEEKIRQLYNCPNKQATVLVIFHKEENKTERITIGDVVDIINHQQADKLTDKEITQALERLKNTKYYLKEQYKEQVKKCPYPELKPISKQTYEDNKKAFDIAIKAIEEFNRQQAEIERLEQEIEVQERMLDNEGFRTERKISEARTEAIKEFADLIDKDIEEKLSDEIKEKNPHLYLIHQIIKDRLKEMVGEDK